VAADGVDGGEKYSGRLTEAREEDAVRQEAVRQLQKMGYVGNSFQRGCGANEGRLDSRSRNEEMRNFPQCIFH
jgi:hypothetical protein